MSDSKLFRHQVRPLVTESSTVLYRSTPVFAASAIGALLFIVLAYLLLTTRYKETEQARGILQSLGPTQQVTAPISGRVTAWHVDEGESVQPGQTLATISRSLHTGSGVAMSHLQVEELQAQSALISAEIELTRSRLEEEKRHLTSVLEDKKNALRLLQLESETSAQQLEIGERQLSALRVLMQRSEATSRAEIDRQQLAILELQRQNQIAARRVQEQETDVNAIQRELNALELKGELALLPLHKQLLGIEQEARQVSREERFTVIAEQGGKLTAMAVPEGQSVAAGQVLASIGYIGGDVEAVVYVPSRVAGKLYEDQEILLSFDAFDFHQYGRYPARIKQISAASLDPREQLLPVPDVREPVFRLTAEVEQRYVQGPQLYPLQAGLLFTADFVIEELPLLHFVLKPVLAMRGLVE